MSRPESKLRWHLSFVFTALLLTALTAVLVMFAFDIPLSHLGYPAISLLALFVLSAPMVYQGRSIARARRDVRLISISIGVVLVGGALLLDFWAWRFGIISTAFGRGYAVTCLVVGPISIFCGYHLTKRLLNS
jgi:O-antigen/teichoic acid export membrane protein